MRKTLEVRIKAKDGCMPQTFEKGDWVDLCTAEDYDMKAGEFTIMSLGVSMEIPEGYTAYIVPRSSTFKKWGLLMVNSVGIIDNSYHGDNDVWGFPALAYTDVFVPKGTRVCQFAILPSPDLISFKPVKSLMAPDRGGFGSTGTGGANG